MGMPFRKRLYRQLEPKAWRRQGFSPLNRWLAVAIIFATVFAMAETEPLLVRGNEHIFIGAQIGFGILFIIEYLARIWTIAEDLKKGETPWARRLRFVRSTSGLIDLAVIIATFLPLIIPDITVLRLLRLFRIFALARLGKISKAMHSLGRAIHSRRYELTVTFGLAIMIMIFGAAALHLIEGHLQPEKFGSIPRALWWAVVTLTTIGYGDVYPITPLGKFVAAIVAISGIGLIAMPTGILAAAFSEAMQEHHDD